MARVRADEHGCLSAYVQPIAERYLSRLRERRRATRASAASCTSCSRTAASTRSSARQARSRSRWSSPGPASGVWGAAELGRLIGEPNVLALDIGGTTAKCSLIEGGHVKIMTDYWIEREPRGRPATRSWCRSSTSSRSATAAAASPGSTTSASCTSARGRPARVPGRPPTGAAGREATTTDANLALGRINPDYFCGGEIEADMAAVRPRARRASRAALGVDASRMRRAASCASPTTTWSTRSSSSRSTAATTRATSRSSPSAAAAACTPSRSARSSACERS